MTTRRFVIRRGHKNNFCEIEYPELHEDSKAVTTRKGRIGQKGTPMKKVCRTVYDANNMALRQISKMLVEGWREEEWVDPNKPKELKTASGTIGCGKRAISVE